MEIYVELLHLKGYYLLLNSNELEEAVNQIASVRP